MIPTSANRSIEGHLSGEKIAMTVDSRAMAHIMSLLTRMYSDPEAAIIREYSTNAHDSHVEANQTRPIEVRTPTALSPYLTITDFGVGLSVDDIHNLYSQYGASTKRGTNDATGMLGIGSKSALAYTSQFTVQGIKDGVKVTVAVSRDEDGSGQMHIIDTQATQEPNGVEVTIPARTGPIEQKAYEFFSYWPKGSVLLNGQEPPSVFENSVLRISEDLAVVNGNFGRFSHSGRSCVVMGNVAYPAGDALSWIGLPWNHNVVARVPIGSLDFAPSREALEFTARTSQALERIAQEVKAQLSDAAKRTVAAAPSAPEAFKLRRELEWALSEPVFYRGEPVPESIALPAGSAGTPAQSYRYTKKTMATSTKGYGQGLIFVTDYAEASLTVTQKKKMLRWKEQNSRSETHFMLIDGPFTTKWIDSAQFVSWRDIQAIKLPKRPRSVSGASGRLAGSYDLVVRGASSAAVGYPSDGQIYRASEIAADKIAMNLPVFYFRGNSFTGRKLAGDFSSKDFTLFCLPANRIDKFVRDNPNAREATSYVRGQIAKAVEALSADEKRAHSMSPAVRSRLLRYRDSVSAIKDPKIVEGVRLAQIDTTPVDTLLQRAKERHVPVAEAPACNPLADYRLLFGVPDAGVEHCIVYMNAIYESKR
jgi:hypothetical protein